MIIYNVCIKTMDGGRVIPNGWVKTEGKKIAAVGEGNPPSDPYSIDGKGGMLIPGFIDPHTHLGIIENGVDFEGDDCNESTDPFTPQLRAIDAVNPFDRCFEEARKSGVTSALIAPGSANPCGGEVFAAKTVGRCIDDMLIRTVGIKFALGENPKRVYSDRDETPMTRMATAAIIREGLFKAQRYLSDMTAYENDKDGSDMPEFDIKSHALMPLLKGEISAHFHCHRADDICTAIRIAKEFSLRLTLIHATEGRLVSDIIKESGCHVVTGPLICDRCKPELSGLELENPSVMSENGINVGICTDHPETPLKYLSLSALAAVKGGMDREKALEAITCAAADAAGIADVTGRIKTGLDADLQLYDGDPLDFMTEPRLVMINGEIV